MRGTTQERYIDVDVDLTGADRIYVTFAQNGRNLVEKTISDLRVEPERIWFTMTQLETLRFDNRKINPPPVEVQIRAGWPNGDCAKSNIMETTAGRLLKDGVI